MRDIKRGDIYYVLRSCTEEGSEQQAGRPAIIVSNNANNAYSPTVEVVYLTTQPKNDLPTHCIISSSSRESTALCEQVTTVGKSRLDGYIATATPEEMQAVDACIIRSLDLPIRRIAEQPTETPEQLKFERDLLRRQYKALIDLLVKQGGTNNGSTNIL